MPQDRDIHSHFMTLLFTSLIVLQTILTHAVTSYGFKNSDPYLPRKVFEITSHLVVINHLVNQDEDLREWVAVNLVCVDMINAIEDENIAVTASEEILTKLTEEYPNKQQNDVKVIHFLHIAELLVLKCSPAFVLSTILPICDRYLEDSKHVQAFENAHSVTLTFFGGVKSDDVDQVLVARVMSYAITLLKTLDVLSKEQFTTAYQSVIKKVSTHSTELTQWCLDGLCDAFKNVELQESKLKVAFTIPTLLPYIEYDLLDDFLRLLERLHLNPWIEQDQDDFLALTYKSIKLVKNEKCLIKCLDWWGEYTSRCRSQPLIKARL
ncbi:hypothetical protein E3Q03_03287 [Wallemia mellicola]|uniref:Uncharacterized protein n=1 Tax=Wallemia mellicola TaxID=1708541 RepID=A0AB74KEX5_9BASI|nr:hypothetical protein E3Q03_03287 [Wallemia mellicola]